MSLLVNYANQPESVKVMLPAIRQRHTSCIHTTLLLMLSAGILPRGEKCETVIIQRQWVICVCKEIFERVVLCKLS
jgi:hypothetical protein